MSFEDRLKTLETSVDAILQILITGISAQAAYLGFTAPKPTGEQMEQIKKMRQAQYDKRKKGGG